MRFQLHTRTLISGLALCLTMHPLCFASPSTEEGTKLAGSVSDMCRLAAPIAVGGGVNASFTSGDEGASHVLISTLASEQDAVLNPASISLDFRATCNFAHTVTLQSQHGGLQNEDPSANEEEGFRILAGYSATLIWGGNTQGLEMVGTSGATTILSQNGAAHGILSLLIQIPGGGDPLVSGAYSDLLVLEFASTF